MPVEELLERHILPELFDLIETQKGQASKQKHRGGGKQKG